MPENTIISFSEHKTYKYSRQVSSMSGEQEILYILSKTLKEVSKKATDSFSGLGIVVYNGLFDHKYRFNMRPSEQCPSDKYLGNPDTIEYLLDLSEKSNPSHDGFTFFEGPELKYIAQYFSPPIVKSVKANKEYGARYLTANFGARLKGVEAIGTISSRTSEYFIFHKLLEKSGIDCVKIMVSDEIEKYISAYERELLKNIEITCEIPPQLKQIVVCLILIHIFKTPFNPIPVKIPFAF